MASTTNANANANANANSSAITTDPNPNNLSGTSNAAYRRTLLAIETLRTHLVTTIYDTNNNNNNNIEDDPPFFDTTADGVTEALAGLYGIRLHHIGEVAVDNNERGGEEEQAVFDNEPARALRELDEHLRRLEGEELFEVEDVRGPYTGVGMEEVRAQHDGRLNLRVESAKEVMSEMEIEVRMFEDGMGEEGGDDGEAKEGDASGGEVGQGVVDGEQEENSDQVAADDQEAEHWEKKKQEMKRQRETKSKDRERTRLWTAMGDAEFALSQVERFRRALRTMLDQRGLQWEEDRHERAERLERKERARVIRAAEEYLVFDSDAEHEYDSDDGDEEYQSAAEDIQGVDGERSTGGASSEDAEDEKGLSEHDDFETASGGSATAIDNDQGNDDISGSQSKPEDAIFETSAEGANAKLPDVVSFEIDDTPKDSPGALQPPNSPDEGDTRSESGVLDMTALDRALLVVSEASEESDIYGKALDGHAIDHGMSDDKDKDEDVDEGDHVNNSRLGGASDQTDLSEFDLAYFGTIKGERKGQRTLARFMRC